MAAVLESDPLVIRPMLGTDVDAVLAVEQSAYEFPWSRQIFLDCLRAGYRCQVGVNKAGIIAHAVSSVVLDEAHLLNICIAKNRQGEGLGREMLDFIRRSFQAEAVRYLFLEVRQSNDVALSLYQSMGFEEIGVRPDYYPASEGREDAAVLKLSLT